MLEIIMVENWTEFVDKMRPYFVSSRDIPAYVFPNDKWYNEKEKCLYHADLSSLKWVSGENVIPFADKCMVISGDKPYKNAKTLREMI